MADRFLFMELRDQRLNRVLAGLRSIFVGNEITTNIHITLKGPQKSFNLKKHIDNYKKENECIQIGGTGRFLNGNSHVVYLKVDCGDLRRYNLWAKPDFDDIYNPHITLYEGTDEALADAVYKFLHIENIQYKCVEYEFTMYTRKQFGLFCEVFFGNDVEQVRLQEHEQSLLERAEKAIERVRTSNKRLQPTAQSAACCARNALGSS